VIPPDPRVTLATPGLAAAWLEGVIAADRYIRPRPLVCGAAFAAVRRAPEENAEQWDQLLFGERFEVLEEAHGWAFGQARRDGYVGHVELRFLAPPARQPTHWVSVRAAHAFAEPDIKSPPRGPYAMNSLVVVEVREGRFAHARSAGWFVEQQLSPIGMGFDDAAAAAERFVGAPYLWGGRGPWGIDCSGLVQQALFACARGCPRDADQQAELGRAVSQDDLRRGDLVFWPGHVAMMVDETGLINANAHHMATVIEPLAETIDRIRKASGDEPIAFRRL
jgi:cell wall-associated NlpC family hydrolase